MATSETDLSDGGDNPALGLNWQVSRWGREDQRGNGNLMNAAKVLEASRLIKTGEIVSLGRRYEAAMPLAPGRVFALRMPGGPTGGPHGGRSRTIWNDEFISTEIGQIGTHMDGSRAPRLPVRRHRRPAIPACAAGEWGGAAASESGIARNQQLQPSADASSG